MFSKGRYKPGKNQIRGRVKPQMLADQRRQLANKKVARKLKPKIVLQDPSVYEPHITIHINFRNLRIPMLLLLLIFLPQVFAKTNNQRILANGVKVNNDIPVALLPRDANCRRNPLGVSKGEICNIGGKTHYVKLFKPIKSWKNHHLSYQEFNHRLIESIIGIKTAVVSFFTENTLMYIASEHVNDIKFIQGQDGFNILEQSDIAKWAAASTFIYDLHTNNVGYTKEGIVALDLDGHDRPLTNNLLINMMNAAHSIYIHTPWLSLDNLKQMKQIYREMQNKPLPEYHDYFHLTEEMYKDMLNAFITICDNVIADLEPTLPEPEHSRPNEKINQLWCQEVQKQTPWQPLQDESVISKLCEKKPEDRKGRRKISSSI